MRHRISGGLFPEDWLGAEFVNGLNKTTQIMSALHNASLICAVWVLLRSRSPNWDLIIEEGGFDVDRLW
jgi:hypothetical protein